MEIKKIRIATLSILMMFLAFAPLFVAPQVSAQASPQVSAISVSKLHNVTPTYLRPASKAVIGPFKATPALVKPNLVKPTVSTSKSVIPYHNPRQGIGKAGATPSALSVPPVVTCKPFSAGCDTISTSAGGATGVNGLNAVDSGGLYSPPTGPGDIEPPDQGLCAGNGFVMEVNNIGELAVFNTGLARVSSDIPLDSLMGLTTIPANIGGPWSSGGDPSCLYDYDNGGHWFITEIVSNSSEASGGTFAGCFAAKKEGCLEGIAVSVTPNPTGPYNVYFLSADFNSTEPGYPYLLNDFAKIGNTRDAFLMFYDEFVLTCPPTCNGIAGGFNGAQEFAFNKKAMELGFPSTSPYFNSAYENMGYFATPDGTCAGVGACWYQVIPAQSPDPTQYDNSYGGSGYMLAPLDFFGAGDNRIAVFYWTGLSTLASLAPTVFFGGQLFSGVEAYRDEGASCFVSSGGFCGLAPQKAGPIPLGDAISHNTTDTGGPLGDGGCAIESNPSGQCPEGGIATNGDGFTQASYAQNQIWGALSTLISQKYCPTTKCTAPAFEIHAGVAYWLIGTNTFDNPHNGLFTLTDQAYVTAMHEDLEFPAIAAGCNLCTLSFRKRAILTFTLSGNGGPTHADNGGFYPSTAFGRVSTSSHGLIGGVINIADLGMSPQDGFTEYDLFGTVNFRPRWGDYSWAIFLPNSGGEIVFATNYIQSPNCSDSAFAVDPSCGGTRDPFANWGTSVNVVVP